MDMLLADGMNLDVSQSLRTKVYPPLAAKPENPG
jgi:hypothetical protein